MKAYVAMIAHNLKGLYSEPAPKIFKKFEKICETKLQGQHSWWNAFLIKL